MKRLEEVDLQNLSLDLICLADKDGFFVELNPMWEKVLGWSIEELCSKPFVEFIHPDDREPTATAAGSIFQGSVVVDFENRYQCKNGSYRWLQWRATIDEKTGHIFAVAREITKLKELELFNENISQVGNIGGWEYDVIENKLIWTAQTYRIHEMPVDSPLDVDKAIDFYVGKDKDRIVQAVEAAVEGGTPYDMVCRLRTMKNKKIWIRAKCFPQFVDGKVVKLIGTFQNVTETKERENELISLRDEAQRLAQSKSIFLANMSHEIRTPMNGVIGMAELLGQSDLDVEQQHLVETLKDSGESLLAIINDILDFSKIEAGKLEIENEKFSLVETLRSTIQPFYHLAEQKNIDLDFTLTESCSDQVIGDVTRIRQIVNNLLSNAVKFTEKGRVLVEVRLSQDAEKSARLRVDVKDTGRGIAEADKHKVFQSFTQLENKNQSHGTGLGLSICRQLAGLMGGEVGFTSVVDIGSHFYFEIPMELAAVEKDEKLKIVRSANDEMPALEEFEVLVVEDNEINQNLLRLMLKKLNVRATFCEKGQEAVDEVQRKEYSLVLMDLRMPVMDGLTATKTIRQLNMNYSPYIVALTANVFKEDRDACQAAGFDGFLEKPLRQAKLIEIIQAVTKTEVKSSALFLDNSWGDLVKNMGGDSQAAKEVVEQFLNFSPKYIEQVRQAIELEDAKEIEFAAHNLKGAAAIVYAKNLVELAHRIETAGASGEIKTAKEIFGRLQEAYESFSVDIKKAV